MSRQRSDADGVFKGGQIWLSQKGFGFIQPEDGGKDVIVHIFRSMSNLNEGQRLSYDVVSERGKLAAANLRNV